MNYYNENDPKAAAWLRELIQEGHIPPGYVDERSILDVRPHELVTFTQQHFFCGIAGWPLALRLAGWPDDRPVRTGSCPCQPFSCAGKGKGTADERHLWPVFRDLITFGEPTVTFGEQVASKAGREWLAGVRADLEGLGYEVGGADLCAAGTGAPHIRQRLYWMAHRQCAGPQRHPRIRSINQGQLREQPAKDSIASGLDNGISQRWGKGRHNDSKHERIILDSDGHSCWLGNNNNKGLEGRQFGGNGSHEWTPWQASVVIRCSDGKDRRVPVEPSFQPLATRIPARVVRLRGYGNSIVPQLAAEFILACEEAR